MKIVKLTKPLRDARGPVEAFTFREPRFEDFAELGDPRVPILSGDRFVWQPVPTLVRSYAERLLVNGDLNVMSCACLRDSIAIQETVLSFFSDLDQKTSSDVSQETSSSLQDKASEA